MSQDMIIDIARDMIWVIIKASAPMLIISLIVGLIISIFQTVTSIQEQTLTFLPKFIAILLIMLLTGAWILNLLVEFTVQLYSNFNLYIS